MRLLTLLLTIFAADAAAQLRLDRSAPNFDSLLRFEVDHPGSRPFGWSGGPGIVAVDKDVVHGGKWSARITRQPDTEGGFSSVTTGIPVDFAGKEIVLKGFLKTESVKDFAAFWIRLDGDTPGMAFDSMQKLGFNGTNDWGEHSVRIPLPAGGKQLFFGFLLSGPGTVWADDIELIVDGKPVSTLPKVERTKTVLDTDREFETSSGINFTVLSDVQIQNLATLARVWGFLKYHHPDVTSGKRHWDYDLFRILPAVLAAADRNTSNEEILKWVDKLSPVPPCTACVTLSTEKLHFKPDLDWLGNASLLGPALSQRLMSIQRNRPKPDKQFFVGRNMGVGNPDFQVEPGYSAVKFPDPGYQLLAVYRFWNIIQYWFPYRDQIGEDWSAVLTRFLPRVALAKTRDEYQLQLMALIATIHDTHANLWSSLQVRPPVGQCQLPVYLRFLDNRAVVTAYADPKDGPASGIKIGDIITDIEGKPVAKLVEEWRPFYAASNEPTRLRDIAGSLTKGPCAETSLRVEGVDGPREIKATRVTVKGREPHDVPGDNYRVLSKDVGYMKLSSVKSDRLHSFIDSIASTKGVIIDIRNYPSDFVTFTLGQLLVDKPSEFVVFTSGDQSNPGAFHYGTPLTLQPQTPHYNGKVVLLIDEVTQSSAEYHSMAFRASPRTTVVGSTTAGADGNVSRFSLPGGLSSMISGIGVFYPDHRPTQRVGIIPDVPARPTLNGVREGRDEVLEEGIRQILGSDASQSTIRDLARQARGTQQ
ncbi:MAG: peptidase S41 [Acidobacteria bacterium]|nr:peptidase S41 [Acidobacteriota bacterium]